MSRFSSRLSFVLDRGSNGIYFRMDKLDEDNNQAVVESIGVLYTPDVARRLGQDIIVEADKADALGGATKDLLDVCTDKYERPKSGS